MGIEFLGKWHLVVLAFGLDLILGDPRWFPHPVRIMGWLTKGLESLLLPAMPSRMGGAILWILVVGFSFFGSWALIRGCAGISPGFGAAVEVVLLWTTLALRDLDREARGVYDALKEGDLPKARERLSRIVSRDTDDLPPREVCRGDVESVAENTVDGVLTPLFYAMLGGAPLAMAFKAISTLDSMLGYKCGPYRSFGWFSAKADDLFNLLPARFCVFLVPLSALLLGMDPKGALSVVLRDHNKTPSPNSGYPEAAFAGALGVRLGGPTKYRGVVHDLPFIGDGEKPSPQDILRAIRLSYGTSFSFLALASLLALLF